jgi:cellulose synthase/poly-beta-1,6-N-acetylglucosamine synthase-like glycosyltransferase
LAGIFFIISLLLLLAYTLLLGAYKKWWLKAGVFITAANDIKTKITLIIPARNEEAHIGRCLQSIQEQRFPKHLLEVMVVDDFSTDGTVQTVQQMALPYVQVLSLSRFLQEKDTNSFKKKGIELAIARATGDLIVTTDADCVAGPEWLTTLAAFYEKTGAVFMAAPVVMHNRPRLVEAFQTADFLTLQGITGATVSAKLYQMCNGANLAYTRTVFNEVGGFKGIDDIASGDDLLLMHKIYTRHPEKVFYLKSKKAIVTTLPMPGWRSFFSQRIRWASKTTRYKNRSMFYTLAGVYLLNLAGTGLLLLSALQPVYIGWTVVFLTVKTLAELNFLLPVARFFGKTKLLWLFPLFQPLHLVYTVIAGWLGVFGKYKWKGREVR